MAATDNGAPSIAVLRDEPTNPHLLRGYGPLAVGIVLLLLMTLLAPTVAREERVTRPREVTTTTVAR
ncbi:MAG TPA: hypothetical protein VFB78_07205 [Acidimicrobiales bacterium]|nr:hypothetical protein [Acidimicrobiales bacterium]